MSEFEAEGSGLGSQGRGADMRAVDLAVDELKQRQQELARRHRRLGAKQRRAYDARVRAVAAANAYDRDGRPPLPDQQRALDLEAMRCCRWHSLWRYVMGLAWNDMRVADSELLHAESRAYYEYRSTGVETQ